MVTRRLTVAGLVVTLLLTIALVGCGRAKEAVDSAKKAAEGAKAAKELQEKGETTVKTDEGEMKIKKKQDGEATEWTFEGKDGKKMITSGGEGADISNLDIPVYPGAKKLGAHTMSTSDADRIAAQFTSTDSFEKVSTFYEDKYPDANKTTMSQQDQQMLILGSEEGAVTRTISVVKKADEDVVNISLVQQKERAEKE